MVEVMIFYAQDVRRMPMDDVVILDMDDSVCYVNNNMQSCRYLHVCTCTCMLYCYVHVCMYLHV